MKTLENERNAAIQEENFPRRICELKIIHLTNVYEIRPNEETYAFAKPKIYRVI